MDTSRMTCGLALPTTHFDGRAVTRWASSARQSPTSHACPSMCATCILLYGHYECKSASRVTTGSYLVNRATEPPIVALPNLFHSGVPVAPAPASSDRVRGELTELCRVRLEFRPRQRHETTVSRDL